jgi:hypothetical protein
MMALAGGARFWLEAPGFQGAEGRDDELAFSETTPLQTPFVAV